MTIVELIAECTAYDFKEVLEEKKPKSWLKSVSAFANGMGGSLFFGVDNDGVVKGLEDVLLWRHLFIQAALVHGCGLMGGVSYRYQIKF